MPTPVVTLPLDYTGQSPDNLIAAELHDVTAHKLIVPDYGSFFKESLVLVDATTLDPIAPVDYMVLELYQDMTVELGKEIYNCIIVDATVTGTVAITYQALGGPYCKHTDNLIAWLEERKINIGSLAWEDVTDKPKKFIPADHRHHVSHVYGMEYIIDELKRVEQAIKTTKGPTYEKVLRDLERKKVLMTSQAHAAVDDNLTARFNGFTSFSNKYGIGLSGLIDAGIMTDALAAQVADPAFNIEAVVDEQYVSSSNLSKFYKTFRDNVVTVEDTNLDRTNGVIGFPTRGQLLTLRNGTVVWLPSKAKAVAAGQEIDDGIYPLGVSDADEFVLRKINGNETNYGGVFMLINRTTLDTYIGALPNDGCSVPIEWNKMLFLGELDEFGKLVQEHHADNKNPHEIDKTDIELHKVENLPVITTDEIINQKSAKKYVTLDTAMYYMKMFLTNAKPPPLPGETLDPNAKTMDDVQIIFSACKKPTPQDDGAPPKGQLLKTFCDGVTRVARYTDGNGSWYDEVLEAVSASCGGGV